jgi:hypothetical protein
MPSTAHPARPCDQAHEYHRIRQHAALQHTHSICVRRVTTCCRTRVVKNASRVLASDKDLGARLAATRHANKLRSHFIIVCHVDLCKRDALLCEQRLRTCAVGAKILSVNGDRLETCACRSHSANNLTKRPRFRDERERGREVKE